MPIISPQEQADSINRWEFGWKVLLRYDQYISATNAKAAFVLALNGAVLTLLFNSIAITDGIKPNWLKEWWIIPTTILTLVIVAVILMTLLTVSPRLWSPKNTKVPESMIYFGSLEKQNCAKYLTLVNSSNDDKLMDDILIQVHTVGSILSEKFELLRKAFWLLTYIQMPLFLLMVTIKILSK